MIMLGEFDACCYTFKFCANYVTRIFGQNVFHVFKKLEREMEKLLLPWLTVFVSIVEWVEYAQL